VTATPTTDPAYVALGRALIRAIDKHIAWLDSGTRPISRVAAANHLEDLVANAPREAMRTPCRREPRDDGRPSVGAGT